MIPLYLRISGFLSYRDPVELDFTTFHLACISGPNGAGKSSLLDAITWALFGQARRRDDSLVNLQSKAAEVVFIFETEGNVHRVQRALPRGKTSVLEFHIGERRMEHGGLEESGKTTLRSPFSDYLNWRPLTERTLRETQARIEQTLHLDYETFVNAAFLLQGKADQFTQQTASKRKDLLSGILGLEMWERYRERTSERRKMLEDDLVIMDGRLAEIEAELSEEEPRKKHLGELEAELQRLAAARKSQEITLENIKRTAASLEQQQALMETMANGLERSRSQLSTLQSRLSERAAVRAAAAELTRHADEIESAYARWQAVRRQLEEWDKVAAEFREHEKDRAPLLEEIAAGKARLEEERRGLLLEQEQVGDLQSSMENLKSEIENSRRLLTEAEGRVAQRAELETQRSAARERQAELRTENEALRVEMDKLKERLGKLESADGATCPLCGQPLSARHRKSTLKQLQAEGKEMGDRFRVNRATADKLQAGYAVLEDEISNLADAEKDLLAHSNSLAQLNERMESLQLVSKDWASGGRKRLQQVEKQFESGKYAVEAQKHLARLDKQLAKVGYDVAAHDQARRSEVQQRVADEQHRKLESARAALAPLDDEIGNLKSEIANRKSEIDDQEARHRAAVSSFEAAQAQLPNLDGAERLWFDLQEQENRARDEVGAARQKVSVLDDLRTRRAELSTSRQSLALQIGQHKALERAFGKDGIPALLIEQALPQIETKANELLDRLSNGQMSVRFITQAEYKDKKREDLKETLDIQISDSAGIRDYEMYSGGEAFRVNFAIRLALAEVLARRKGARLQTLVIDEGFGSQDTQGRQRLIEAINLVKGDFARILVITHLDELKDAFPTRIEVEKTEQGSCLTVI